MSSQKSNETTALQPRITLVAEDYERLSALTRAAMNNMPDLAEGLAEELARADVLEKGARFEDIICMGTAVEFCDNASGKVQRITLVYPEQADISQGKISVLTPVGTALIGLRAGQSIDWQTKSGEIRRLTVIAVGEPGPASR